MQHRNLGSQGLRVSALGLGIMGMSMAYGASNDDEGIATIRRAHEVGIDFFDTAELYGAGTGSNEILLGKAVKNFRDEVALATKFGFDMTAPAISPAFNSRPENIRKVAENSLRYLQSDHIDLFYQHISDPAVPVEEVAGVVGELIAEGKVKYFGLSNVGPQYIRRAHAVTPVSVLQYEYSLFEREVEEKILPVLRELGIGLVPYSPLGRGFLTGQVKPASEYPADDMRSWDERWQGENYTYNVRATKQLKNLADTKGTTTAQLALAWLLAQGEDIAPIPGTRSTKRIEENAGAVDVQLSAADLARIAEILPHGSAGSRLPAAVLSSFTTD
ncbi:aryl-alcohol dehydrogenase-like predicted oxidoreductase [Streptomyces umbrinus]|uniref:Aryl-alcohol dehydrogenase-like predicted oxidoreductase n=1 Tax=Streptomyces umbrinus TaxID=67370 RepID=A0ABU0T5M6_9ACTN|nr:aldo/keto reductase [Streptomyces umbrinus]MDQ1030983.1 aryl-alcohol dehydrogenase-like predicted oxidoreductase [Streptomyces umbrinus]